MDKPQTAKRTEGSTSRPAAKKKAADADDEPREAKAKAKAKVEEAEDEEKKPREEEAADEDDADDEESRDDEDEEHEEDGDEKEEAEEKPRPRRVAPRRPRAAPEPEVKRGRGRDLVGVVVCVVVVLFARASLADHYVVPTGSMEPTVAIDDRVVVSKSAYGLRVPLTDFWLLRWGTGPKRGDVVVLESPEGGTILLKRVVGLPGDTITVHGGEISVNGAHMPVTGGVEDLAGKQHLVRLGDGGRDFPNGDVPSAKLPENKYLVMGDNRGNSKDGRYFGLVDEDVILGHAVRIYWSGDSQKSFLDHFSWKPL